MQALKTLSGGAFVQMTFQVEDAFSTAGVPACWGLTGDAGLIIATTTSATNMVGLTTDTASANDANLITCIVNPDLIIRAKMSGGATADTALTVGTVGASSTTTTIDNITGITPNSPDMDDGIVWMYSGADVGATRAIATTDANTITVLNALSSAPASGDEILIGPRYPGVMSTVTLTTNVDQVNCGTAETPNNGADFRVIDGEFKTTADEGTTDSHYHLYSASHALSGGETLA